MRGVGARDNVGMQGTAESDRVLLDAAAVCGHLVQAGSVHALLAEHRSRLFPDELFGDLFASGRGRPSVPGEVVAVVMVLQALEGLSDREACRRLQTDVGWKAAAGLALTDEAFHPTVLTLWRNKLRASERPDRIFDAVRDLIALSGAVAGRDRRVLDSTVLDDAVARQDTVTMVTVQMRRVRKLVPALGEVPVRERNLDPAGAVVDWDDPDDRERLVSELVDDALDLIGAAEDLDLDESQADAVGLLALVAGQDVEPAGEPGRWRIARGTAKGRVISVVDPQSRHTHKTAHSYRDGYKAHIAAEPHTGLITAADLTAGDVSDADAAMGLLQDGASRNGGARRQRLWHRRAESGLATRRDRRGDQAAAAAHSSRRRLQRRRLRHRLQHRPRLRPLHRHRRMPRSPHRRDHPPKATPASAAAAANAPSGTAAPPPRTGAPSRSTPTTASSKQPAPKPAPKSSATPTAPSGPWPNEPSHGPCAEHEDAPTSAPTKTGTG